ncbi:MAG: glycosyltransferase family 39 protein, partial [Chloroflexi bacterium]|nr:glycosyltransferase family 39 protein [Chloroflexota bacterium]
MKAIAPRGQRWVIFSLALFARYLVFLDVFHRQGFDPVLRFGPDGLEFNGMARSLIEGRGFADRAFILRPPLWPMTVAGVYLVGGIHPTFALLLNAAIGALTAVVTYHFVKRLSGDSRVAFAAGLFVALDPGVLAVDVSLLADTLFNLLVTLALLFFVRFLTVGPRRPVNAWLSAASCALAALARPGGINFTIALAATLIFLRWRWWRWALIYVGLIVLTYVGWSYRNYAYTGIFEYSTIGPYDLLFYRSVSAVSHGEGRPPAAVAADFAREIERRLGKDPSVITEDNAVGWPDNLYPPNAARYRVMQDLVNEHLFRYPLWLVLVMPVSLVRMLAYEYMLAITVPPWMQIVVNAVF